MSLPIVERTFSTLPQEQVAVISSYLGWISAFMGYLYLLGRLAIQPEVAHQTSLIKNEYSIAILGILERE